MFVLVFIVGQGITTNIFNSEELNPKLEVAYAIQQFYSIHLFETSSTEFDESPTRAYQGVLKNSS